MDIFLHEEAEKFLKSLDKKVYINITNHIKILSDDNSSKNLDIKKLKGLPDKQPLFRLRVGNYRIIYFIESNNIWITEIILRNKGYDI